MPRLKSRVEACIGGFQFIDPQISHVPLEDWGFNSLVTKVIERREQNRRFGLSENRNQVADEVDRQNAHRMLTIRHGEVYTLPDTPATQQAPAPPPPVFPETKPVPPTTRVPRLAMVYIYAMGGEGVYRQKAAAFVQSYIYNPPGMEHDTVIVCNGVPANDDTRALFSGIPNCKFLDRDDSGWDIGGFQHAAQVVPCDLMLFLGGHSYFRKPGWLQRMMDVYSQFGDTLYGATGNQGDLRAGVHPHVRTTGFWCPPSLMNDYPHRVTQKGQGGERYNFEHGATCHSNWVRQQGLQPWIVGWESVVPLQVCDVMPECFHQGTQSNVLIGDRLTCPPYYPHA